MEEGRTGRRPLFDEPQLAQLRAQYLGTRRTSTPPHVWAVGRRHERRRCAAQNCAEDRPAASAPLALSAGVCAEAGAFDLRPTERHGSSFLIHRFTRGSPCSRVLALRQTAQPPAPDLPRRLFPPTSPPRPPDMVNAPPSQFKRFDVDQKLAELSIATKIKLLGGKVRRGCPFLSGRRADPSPPVRTFGASRTRPRTAFPPCAPLMAPTACEAGTSSTEYRRRASLRAQASPPRSTAP